jgi:hypothetical protein
VTPTTPVAPTVDGGAATATPGLTLPQLNPSSSAAPARALVPLDSRGRTQTAPGIQAPQLEETMMKPFNGFLTGSLFNRGPLGYMDLSLGLTGGTGPIMRNVAVNAGARFNPWLRAHVTAVARPDHLALNHLTADQVFQEGYVEASEVHRMLGGDYLAGMRFGKVQNLAFAPGPLSMFEAQPLWMGRSRNDMPGYGQLVPFYDWQHDLGFGFHLAGQGAFLGERTGFSGIDGYMRLRRMDSNGYVMELRGGWMQPRFLILPRDLPLQPQAGTALFVGKQWAGGTGVGIVAEQLIDEPFRIGARLSVPTSAASQALGNFMGRPGANGLALAAQVPLARLNLGEQATTPPPGGVLVGTVQARRVYRSAARIGGDQYPINDEYIVRKQGLTEAKGLIRVTTEGPRSLSGVGTLQAPSGSDAYVTEYTQDVVYSYYRVVPFSDTWLEGKVFDKDNPERKISQLTLRLKGPGPEQALSPTDGDFKVQRPVPYGKKPTVTVVASAPGYLEEVVEARLTPGGIEKVQIPLRPLKSTVLGRLVDADTGKPIPEVETLLTLEGGQPVVVLTDTEGEFRMPNLAPGTYSFATNAPRHHGESLTVAIDPGQTKRLELRLRPRAASVAGRLVDGADKPLGGVAIHLSGPDGHEEDLVTLADGSYGVTALRSGRYTLTLTVGGERLEKTLSLQAGEVAIVDLKSK